ncbi:hypothetical protein QWY90_08860 [Flavobacterium paronense]|uniref:DUF1566 domain-containing protein n=1 Tax=Flavobacterium paronense TaxID=1392775 RepID=A0ABV5GBA2_9FLAO|nr:hypothetical protein [Flavobacterium paronense]MDN3677427.1 hypothetical protein [Flavobacterium paronense]
MRNIKIILVLFLLTSAFVGCSSDSGGGETFSTVVLTTKPAVLTNNNLVVSCGGTLSSSFSNSNDCEAGICYSTVPNPTVLNQVVNTVLNLDFTCSFGDVVFGETYYIKAFIRNFTTGEVKYGNEISITIPNSITTDIVKNISCSGFSVDVTVASSLSANTERGICYSTSHNPTIDNQSFSNSTAGEGTFAMTITNLSIHDFVFPNTTYYLKSYVKFSGVYYYGNEVSFKVPGYIGGSGGYVFFDKGETTNGWRYLEAAPSNLVYNNNVNWLFNWNGCNSTTFLNGISNDIGTGLENTAIIRATCNFTDNAAAMASSTSLNGKSDWFLPSIEELKKLYTLRAENVYPVFGSAYPIISSSQLSNNSNFGINYSNGNQVTMFKSDYGRIWQVRRF